MWPAQLHDHDLDLGVSVGPLGLRVVLLGMVMLVAGYTLLRPFSAGEFEVNPRWVTTAAGSGVLIALLLSGDTTVPRQLVVLLIVAAAVPIYATYRRAPALLERLAPGALVLAGVGAAVLFTRSLLSGAGFSDGLVLALIGMSWLVLCRFRSRPAGRLSAAAGWLLASAAVAGAGQVAMLALTGG